MENDSFIEKIKFQAYSFQRYGGEDERELFVEHLMKVINPEMESRRQEWVKEALDRIRKAGEPYDHTDDEYPRITRICEEIRSIEAELEAKQAI